MCMSNNNFIPSNDSPEGMGGAPAPGVAQDAGVPPRREYGAGNPEAPVPFSPEASQYQPPHPPVGDGQVPPNSDEPRRKHRNALGLVAFITSIIGFVFACMPGALIVGWILLPIAFVLSLVSLFMKGQTKGLGISGLVISVVGTVVGVIVAFGTFVLAVDDALSGGEVSVSSPETQVSEPSAAPVETEAAPVEGSRETPFPIGSTVTQGDWAVTINSVNLDANGLLADENLFNEPPADGTTYIMVNVTAQYVGTNAEGEMPSVLLDYVTVDGNTIDGFDAFVVSPEEFDSVSTLYEGASTTGNRSFQVPADSAGDGVLALTPHVFGDKVFVAVK